MYQIKTPPPSSGNPSGRCLLPINPTKPSDKKSRIKCQLYDDNIPISIAPVAQREFEEEFFVLI